MPKETFKYCVKMEPLDNRMFMVLVSDLANKLRMSGHECAEYIQFAKMLYNTCDEIVESVKELCKACSETICSCSVLPKVDYNESCITVDMIVSTEQYDYVFTNNLPTTLISNIQSVYVWGDKVKKFVKLSRFVQPQERISNE